MTEADDLLRQLAGKAPPPEPPPPTEPERPVYGSADGGVRGWRPHRTADPNDLFRALAAAVRGESTWRR